MPKPAVQAKPVQILEPRWDKIMEILGTPLQEAVYVNGNPNDFESWDGAWDMTAAVKGLGMRRVKADIGKHLKNIDGVDVPSAILFVCTCGHARRLIDSEFSFTCERPNNSGAPGCGIHWEKEVYQDDDEIDPGTGDGMWKAKLEVRSTPNGKKYMVPVIKGMRQADWLKQKRAIRKAQAEADPEAAKEREAQYVRSKMVQLTPDQIQAVKNQQMTPKATEEQPK